MLKSFTIKELPVFLRGRNKVRTFWENTVDEIEITIYGIPAFVRCKTGSNMTSNEEEAAAEPSLLETGSTEYYARVVL